MVWPFSAGSNGSSSSYQSDPLKDLDPSLRDFLEKESPVKFKPAEPAPQPSPRKPFATSSQAASEQANSSDSTSVPSESLFQDGRYAHLWKTYRPLAAVESSNKTSSEKLSDVLDAYKTRKASIGAAALENCALEQMRLQECLRGGLTQRLGMCRTENKALDRCYTLNTRFLKALGYLSVVGRSEGEEERIQMHADKLYQRMLEQERLQEEARKQGREAPPSQPLFGDREGVGVATEPLPKLLGELQASTRKDFEARLKGLSGQEKELEERAIAMEIVAGRETGKLVKDMRSADSEARKERKNRGEQTLGDRVSSFFGW